MPLILEKCTILRWNGVLLLREICESFERNRITHISGGNGVGKTSLLRCMAGYYAASSGCILLDGQSLSENAVTYIGHDNGLKLNLTPYENIMAYGRIIQLEQGVNHHKIQSLIDAFRLKSLLDIPTYYLSHGQKRRVALAMFFLKESDIYLLDEPINGLDTQSICDFHNYIHAVKHEKIIIMTNHQSVDFKYDDVVSLEKYKP